MEEILYNGLIGALSAGIIAGIAILFKFIVKKSIGSADDETDGDKKEKESEFKIPVQKKKHQFQKSVAFIHSKKKTIVTFMVVCSFLFLISFLFYNVCTFGMQEAYYHYNATRENYYYTYSIGCGENYCQYCEGTFKIQSLNESVNPYAFGYYTEQSNARTAFQVIGVVSLILAIVSLFLLVVCSAYNRKKKIEE